jgi:hypothetical protein
MGRDLDPASGDLIGFPFVTHPAADSRCSCSLCDRAALIRFETSQCDPPARDCLEVALIHLTKPGSGTWLFIEDHKEVEPEESRSGINNKP